MINSKSALIIPDPHYYFVYRQEVRTVEKSRTSACNVLLYQVPLYTILGLAAYPQSLSRCSGGPQPSTSASSALLFYSSWHPKCCRTATHSLLFTFPKYPLQPNKHFQYPVIHLKKKKKNRAGKKRK